MEVKKIIETSELPLGEKVYLKKDFLGWRVVHPIRNEDGSMNWFNLFFGSKSNLLFLVVVAILMIAFYFGVNELLGMYKQVADNPCAFCTTCHEQCSNLLSSVKTSGQYKLNLSTINLTAIK